MCGHFSVATPPHTWVTSPTGERLWAGVSSQQTVWYWGCEPQSVKRGENGSLAISASFSAQAHDVCRNQASLFRCEKHDDIGDILRCRYVKEIAALCDDLLD